MDERGAVVKNVVRASKVLALVPLLFLLTSCFDYSLTGSPSREKLLGTWVAADLPGEPTMTFIHEPFYRDNNKLLRKDGQIEFHGWPVEVFDQDSILPASEADWSTPRDWTGTWALRAPGLVLNMDERDDQAAEENLIRIGAAMEIYDSLFSLSCMDVYFARDENVAPTKMCKTT